MSFVARTFAASMIVAAVALPGNRALAGPVELLDGVLRQPGDPNTLAVRFRNAGGGTLLSRDGGKTFAFLCNAGVDADLRRESTAALIRSDGTILFGVFDGMWRGDANACGFVKDTAFEGQWITDLVVDPRDSSRTYAITSAGGKLNTIHVNDGKSDKWTALGTPEEILINRLHVAKKGSDGVRLYESIVRGTHVLSVNDAGIPDELPRYLIRYSDDMGKTWTEHDFGQTEGAVRMVGVDPTNADHIVVAVIDETITSGSATAPDVLMWSDAAGAPGSFEKVGEVTELCQASGSWCPNVTFAPDGRLFYGDREQSTPGLFAVDKLGAAPKRINDEFKVQCVHYDVDTDKLFVCQDRALGTADPKTGKFSEVFDMTSAAAFVDCAGVDMASQCEQQLTTGWCGITHYPSTPLCKDYGLVPADAGLTPQQDAALAADGGKPDQDDDDGGCSVAAAPGTSKRSVPGWFALLGLSWLGMLRRRRDAACDAKS